MERKLHRKLSQCFSDFTGILIIILVIVLASSFIWVPIVAAQLSYNDWTCAFKECVIVKGAPWVEMTHEDYGTTRMEEFDNGEF